MVKQVLVRVLLVLICVCGIALAYLIYSIMHVSEVSKKITVVNEAQDSFMKGDFETVRDRIKDAQNIQPGISLDVRRSQTQSLSLSNNPTDQYEAFSQIKQDYTSAKNSLQRVTALNRLVDFLVRNRTQQVFDMVFQDPDFAQYKQPNLAASVRSISFAADAILPSVYSKYWKTWNSVAAATTTIALQKRAENALDSLRAGDKLFEEQRQSYNSPLAPFDTLYLYYIRGTMYEGIAKVYPEISVKEALASYVDGETYYASLGTQPIALAEMRMPYIYIAHARLLLRSKQDTAGAALLLKKAVTMMQANPSVHERGYGAVIDRVAAGKSISQEGDYATLKELAAASPEFKAFVKQYGVSFDK